jgi:hypothetical protein
MTEPRLHKRTRLFIEELAAACIDHAAHAWGNVFSGWSVVPGGAWNRAGRLIVRGAGPGAAPFVLFRVAGATAAPRLATPVYGRFTNAGIHGRLAGLRHPHDSIRNPFRLLFCLIAGVADRQLRLNSEGSLNISLGALKDPESLKTMAEVSRWRAEDRRWLERTIVDRDFFRCLDSPAPHHNMIVRHARP